MAKQTTEDDKKIIYTMHRVSKYHGAKQVLKEISLSYYYAINAQTSGASRVRSISLKVTS